MNKNQKIVLIAGALLLVISFIFPFHKMHLLGDLMFPSGYYYFNRTFYAANIHGNIDVGFMGFQYLVIISLIVILIFLFNENKQNVLN